MWIRSQSQTILINSDYIIVNDNDILAKTNSNSFLITIGTYSSEEKALKVLDMIQTTLMGKKTKTFYEFQKDKHITHNFFKSTENLVFKMPLDSEVELESETIL